MKTRPRVAGHKERSSAHASVRHASARTVVQRLVVQFDALRAAHRTLRGLAANRGDLELEARADREAEEVVSALAEAAARLRSLREQAAKGWSR